jgi:HEPN domain-containing protein
MRSPRKLYLKELRLKQSAEAWLEFARRDFSAAHKLLNDEYHANIVFFLCQQTIEKTLKAVLEEAGTRTPKIHNTKELYRLVSSIVSVDVEFTFFELIDSIYTESRYPASMGLLPSGFPTIEQAIDVFEQTERVFTVLLACLKKGRLPDSP